MKLLERYFILGIKNLRFLSSIAGRLARLTGKSPVAVHPKHLLKDNLWFETYLVKTDKVLDLGCGSGQISLKIARKVKAVTAIDKNVSGQVKQKNILYGAADLEKKLEFNDKTFDAVLCLDVLEHLHNRTSLLREIKRILKPGGLLFLSLPNSGTSWKKLQRKYRINSFADRDHKAEFSQAEARFLLSRAGFDIISVESITLDTPLAPLIDLTGGISLPLYKSLTDWKRRMVNKHEQETTGFRFVCRN